MNEISISNKRSKSSHPSINNQAQDSREQRYEFVAHYLNGLYREIYKPNCCRLRAVTPEEASEEIQASRKKAVLVFMRQICDQTELDSRAVDQFMAAKSKDSEQECLVDFAIQLLREKRHIKDAISIVDPLLEKKPKVYDFYFMPKSFKQFLERIVAEDLSETALECINALEDTAFKDTMTYYIATVLAEKKLNDQALEALKNLSDRSPLILTLPQPVLRSFIKNDDLESAVKLKHLFDPAKFNSDRGVQYRAKQHLGCIIGEISERVRNPASDLKMIFEEYFEGDIGSSEYFKVHGETLFSGQLQNFYMEMKELYRPAQVTKEKMIPILEKDLAAPPVVFTFPHFSKEDTLDYLMSILIKKGLLEVIGNTLSEIDGHNASELDLESFKATKVYEALIAIRFFDQVISNMEFSVTEKITSDDICKQLLERLSQYE